MAEHDWAKEMKKIDRQLESISDEALAARLEAYRAEGAAGVAERPADEPGR